MLRTSRRITIVGAVVVVLLAQMTAAWADDLDDYLDRAAGADYGGRRVVVTMWEGVAHSEVFDVEHAADVTMVEMPDASTVVGDGKVAVTGAGGIALSGWSAPFLSERYETGEPESVTRLGRQAFSVTVFEAGRARAMVVFDAETWAPLTTEVYDDRGEMFRFTTFTEFDPNPRRVYGAMRGDREYDVVTQIDGSTLPDEAGGYARLDAYVDPAGVTQAYFSDGLFSFSVFAIDAAGESEQFDDAVGMEIDGQAYDVLVNAAEVWVRWKTGEVTLLLVGDLPPDHLEEVLRSLPAPDGGGLLDRLWRGLFG